jgi:HicB_like antitoxin of bacterial toxin-antitoxin system
MRYPVVVHKDPDSDYGVTVPDLPGCFSAGETLPERVLSLVDKWASENGETRSGLIAQAALEYIASRESATE